jgi:multiple sugar transport system substrate-binding protein
MRPRYLPIAVITAVALSSVAAVAQTELTVNYSQPELWRVIHESVAAEFEEQNPGIKVVFPAPSPNYNEGILLILRGAITGANPDVSFQGLNHLRVIAARDLAVPLTDFIAKEKDWEARGYHQALMDLGSVNGVVYGIAFGVSTPLLYYNGDLVRQAGGSLNNLPTTWEGIIDLGRRINALGDKIMGFSFPIYDGGWYFQSAVTSQGATMVNGDETEVTVGGEAGVFGARLLRRLVEETGMKHMGGGDARKLFRAGRLGMLINSAAGLKNHENAIGDRFDLRTGVFPVPTPKGRLAAGGNAGIILTQDPEKQRLAWEYLKLAGSAFGSTTVVKNSGYMPVNKLAITDPTHLGEFYKKNPNYQTAVSQLSALGPWYAFPGENSVKINEVIFNNLMDAMTGKTTPEAAMQTARMEGSKMLPK